MAVGCPRAEQKQASWGDNQERATEGTGPGDRRSTVSEKKKKKKHVSPGQAGGGDTKTTLLCSPKTYQTRSPKDLTQKDVKIYSW